LPVDNINCSNEGQHNDTISGRAIIDIPPNRTDEEPRYMMGAPSYKEDQNQQMTQVQIENHIYFSVKNCDIQSYTKNKGHLAGRQKSSSQTDWATN